MSNIWIDMVFYAETHKTTHPIYKKYSGLAPSQRDAFAKQHAASLLAYETSYNYLKTTLNSNSKIPTNAWKTEKEKLLQERTTLAEQYYTLKDDVKSAETIRRGAENILNDHEPTAKYTQGRTRDQDL